MPYTSKLDWGSYISFISKTAIKKIGALKYIKFFSSSIVLNLYKSAVWPCMEYYWHVYCHVTSNVYMEKLDKLLKRVCVFCTALARLFSWMFCSSSKSSQFVFFGINLEDIHLTWLNWLPFLLLVKGLLVILIYCKPFRDAIRMSLSTISSIKP